MNGSPGRFGQLHGGRLAEPDVGQFVLVDVRDHPDYREVGQPVERHPRLHPHAAEGHLLQHEALVGRVQRHGAAHFAGVLERADLGLADVPEFQTAPGRVHQRLAAAGHLGVGACRQLPARFEGGQILLLGRHQLGAVKRQQRRAFPDGRTREVHEELLDPPADLRRDRRKALLVVLDPAVGTDDLFEHPALHRPDPYADHLLAFGGELNGTRRHLHHPAVFLERLHGEPAHVEVVRFDGGRRAVPGVAGLRPGGQGRREQEAGGKDQDAGGADRDHGVPPELPPTAASRSARLFP